MITPRDKQIARLVYLAWGDVSVKDLSEAEENAAKIISEYSEVVLKESLELLGMATRFLVGHTKYNIPVTIELRNEGMWCVKGGTDVLTNKNKWVYEPLPSSRTENFIKATRFTRQEAFLRAKEVLRKEI